MNSQPDNYQFTALEIPPTDFHPLCHSLARAAEEWGLVVGNELVDVYGQLVRLVVHHQVATVLNPHTSPHVGQQQLVEERPVAHHKVT